MSDRDYDWFPETAGQGTCRHCQVRMVRVKYRSGERWMHTHNMDLYWYCKGTAGLNEALTGQVPVPTVAGP